MAGHASLRLVVAPPMFPRLASSLAIAAFALGIGALFVAGTGSVVGCLDADGGGTSSSGGGATDAGEGGTSSAADAGLVWGCADNGTSCYCYSPAPAEYTQTSCISYACCITTVSNGQHACQCTNDSPCSSTDTSAVRVASCP